MKSRIGWFAALLLITCNPITASAEVVFGDNVPGGLFRTFQMNNSTQSGNYRTSGLAFDPTSTNDNGFYDRVYLANYATSNSLRGIYSVDIFAPLNEQGHNLQVLQARDAPNEANNDADYPADVIVDANGDLRVNYDRSEAVWKVENPLADPAPSGPPTEVETQMLGAYGNPGAADDDDDIISIAFVPSGFGGGFTPGEDIVTFDQGHDGNFNFSISVVDANSTVGTPLVQEIYSDTGLGGGTDNIDLRGDASEFDGFAYFARFNYTQGREMFIDDLGLGGGDQPYIERVNGAGDHEYIFLDLPGGFADLTFDDVLQVNPVDGSVWFAINNNGSREIYRVDIANEEFVFNSDYTAPTTLEISFLEEDPDDENSDNDTYNVDLNSMAFSPDGKYLTLASDRGTIDDGRDQLFVYRLTGGLTGDLNNDGFFNEADINAFVEALTDRDSYTTNYPGADPETVGDFNGDGMFSLADIAGFKAALQSLPPAAQASAVPEPTTFVLLSFACCFGLIGIRGRRRE